MNLLQGLKNRLQVLTLKKDLKAAQQAADNNAWQERGRQCIDGISTNGKFLGNARDRVSTMKFALAGIKEAGSTPSLEPTAGLQDPENDSWLRIKRGEELNGVNGGHDGDHCVMSAYLELAAATEAKESAKPAAKPSPAPSTPKAAVPAPAPAASKPGEKTIAIRPAASPVSAALKAAPAAYKPGSSPFAKKPSFDHLSGMERATASMKWQSDRKAWYAAEAERQVAAEEAAAKVDPTAGQPVTAASIASEIIRQQAEAARPKPSAWSRESGARRERVAKLAAELAAKDPI